MPNIFCHSFCNDVVCLQSHVTGGDQLVHSAFLQSLASLAVGLSLDQLLCRHPTPPHHTGAESGSCPPEWNWLATFATTVKSAEALAKGAMFPESFAVPGFQQSGMTEIPSPLVRQCSRVISEQRLTNPLLETALMMNMEDDLEDVNETRFSLIYPK